MARPRILKDSKVSDSPARKRSRSPETVRIRQSKRPSRSASAKSTPHTHVYREADSSDELETVVANEESGYEDEDASEDAADDPDEEAEEDDSEQERSSKRRKSGGGKGNPKTANGSISRTSSKDLWREGAKIEGEGEVIIALPKPRSAGKTPYQDDTIHPNTLLFLGDLKKNNDREWLKLHDKDFRQSEKDWRSFVELLTEKLIEKDETIPELPFKDVVLRIYRDVRFSPDPTPYKTHFSAAFSRTGRKGPYAAYYIQISPGSSFIGGGIWQPDADRLNLLRRAMDGRSHKLKKVLMYPGIRKVFLGNVQKDDKKAVKAFCTNNSENALKRCPKGYNESHPQIDLLRLRNFTMGKKIKDEEVLGPNGMSNIAEMFGTLTPFVTYLNSVVMPEPGDSSDEDEEEEASGDDEEE